MGYSNFNKHKHRNSIGGRGGVYLSYKANSHKYHPRQKKLAKKVIKSYLRDFWVRFYCLDPAQKIELLKEASYKKYHYPFNYLKNRKRGHRMTNTPCKVCGRIPTLIHHIVLVKNGGLNKNSNYIRLCELCHAQIHDWLLDEVIEKMEETLNNEMDTFVSLPNS